MEMTKEELNEIIESHGRWVYGGKDELPSFSYTDEEIQAGFEDFDKTWSGYSAPDQVARYVGRLS